MEESDEKSEEGRSMSVKRSMNMSWRQEEGERKWGKKGKGGRRKREAEIEMKDVGTRGRTEGDSGEKAGKWVRGGDDDVEAKEEESDEGDGERDTRGRSKRGMERQIIMEVWRAALPGAENQIIKQMRHQSCCVSGQTIVHSNTNCSTLITEFVKYRNLCQRSVVQGMYVTCM